DHQKDQDLGHPEPAELLERLRPQIQENGLDIEQNEEDGRQVELHGHLVFLADGGHAALERLELLLIALVGAAHEGSQRAERRAQNDTEEEYDEDRQVGVHRSCYLLEVGEGDWRWQAGMVKRSWCWGRGTSAPAWRSILPKRATT